MTWLWAAGRAALWLLCCLWLTGCAPVSSGPMDEQRDPHFIAGKNKVRAYDFEGAIESFLKAVEANPSSASAHFELGVLYREHSTNAAAAIYHFERYLKLQPASEFAEPVRQHILACKQELASSVLLDPLAKGVQRDLDRLTKENEYLKGQVEQLQAALARRPPPPVGTGTPTTPVTQVVPTSALSPSQVTVLRMTRESQDERINPRTLTPPSPQTTRSSTAVSPRPKTHIVRKGETAYAIARRYGLTVPRLCAANPTLDRDRVRVGQTLTIPGS